MLINLGWDKSHQVWKIIFFCVTPFNYILVENGRTLLYRKEEKYKMKRKQICDMFIHVCSRRAHVSVQIKRSNDEYT